MSRLRKATFTSLLASLVLLACAHTGDPAVGTAPFTVAVIPDTQNYVDYSRQKAEGFAIDSSVLFIDQMRSIAARSVAKGGNVVFVVSVGDVWQHQTERMDADHAARGFEWIENRFFDIELKVTDKAKTIEMPKAVEGYEILAAAGLPFGVAPGNHDYDAMWSAAGFPPNLKKNPRELTMTAEDIGLLHIGGLDNFRSVFGAGSDFFRDKPWYVDHFAGGANSAQTFSAGGYTFLHIALEMQAPDEVLAWAETVLAEHPGLPTIVTTHDYLATDGRRVASPLVDLDRLDPDQHNSAEELWTKLISQHDQIFLVLCGHNHGQSKRVDANVHGHAVHQVLADYQERGQAGLDAGQPLSPYTGHPPSIGDGWYRLMTFDLAADPPRLRVRTHSSHYDSFSSELATYAEWYKAREQPELTDAEFHAADNYEIVLEDFRERFGRAGGRR
ncbi:MAG: metallophosphoesterase [Planctomycetota bacterium]|jgi:hypothetical protein